MRRVLVLALIVAASSVAAGAASSPAATMGKCIPDKQLGVQVVDHVAVIVYCGHAKLTLKEGSKVTRFTGGMCVKPGGGTFTVGFGKYTAIIHPIAIANALTLEAPAPSDGTYRLGLLTVQKKGKKATVADNVKVVIVGKRSRGTFSGKFTNGAKFTGSFTCK